MTKITKLFAICALSGFTLIGCGDDDGGGEEMGTEEMGMAEVGPDGAEIGPTEEMGMVVDTLLGMDAPPAIGTQIDRMGRAGITTATIASFTDRDAPAAERNDVKDQYNANSDPSTWVSSYQAAIDGVIAAFDGLDGECGNQVGFDFDAGGTSDYDFLSLALADDRLFVNSASGTCGLYLAVEAGILGVDAALADCGGRTPNHDVIDITYTYLVAGPGSVLAGDPPAISDGLTSDSVTHSDSDFPFFADN
ncbi:MAG: hypothetical protein AAF411_17260 [Myxococcota bacterium]